MACTGAVFLFQNARVGPQGLHVLSDKLICVARLLEVRIYCGSCNFLLCRRCLLFLAGAAALRGNYLLGDRSLTTPLRDVFIIKQCSRSSYSWGGEGEWLLLNSIFDIFFVFLVSGRASGE